MPDSILDLPDEYKDQLIEALVRLRSLDGERVWVLNVRLIDGTVLSEDAVEYKGPFREQGLNRIAPLLDRSGLVYVGGPAWSSNNDETEWTATLYRKVDWRKHSKDS